MSLLLAVLVTPAPAQIQDDARLVAIANERVRIGVDLARGGAIAWLSDLATDAERNLINVHDPGRYVQQSYYAGPAPFGEAHPAWKGWPWNPIGAGDAFGNRADILEHRVVDGELYVKTRPMQWALNNVPGDCVFETWITLHGPVARVRCRLTNQRTDKTVYPPMTQELPAVYTIADLHRLLTYTGDRPFTGDALSRIERVGIPWNDWHATEHWAACVGADDRGVGVVHPGVVTFKGGFNVPPGRGGALDDATGYISPIRFETLEPDAVYDYAFDLVVGDIDTIRAHAAARRPAPITRIAFDTDRRHCVARNADDRGVEADRGWTLRLTELDPQIITGDLLIDAADAPTLLVRAAFTGDDRAARVFFQRLGDDGFAAERSVAFDVTPDGQLRTYRVPLVDHADYRGLILRYRIDHSEGATPSGTVRLEWIGFEAPSE